MQRTRSAMQKGYKNQLNLKSPSTHRKSGNEGNRYAVTGRTSPSHHLIANVPTSLQVDVGAPTNSMSSTSLMSTAITAAASGNTAPPGATVSIDTNSNLLSSSNNTASAMMSINNSAAITLGVGMGTLTTAPLQPVRINRAKWQTVINDQKLRRDLDDAIELDDLPQIRAILDKKPNLAHAPDEDGLLAVDLAILLERFTVAKVLIQNGAVHSDLLYDFASLESLITRLQDEAALGILQLTARMFSASQSVKGFDKDLRILDKRHKRLKAIRSYLSIISFPPPPDDVNCEVRSETSVRVSIRSAQESSAILALRYKVEWSERADFADAALQCAVINSTQGTVSHLITNLRKGSTVYIRAQIYSLRGWSSHSYPDIRHIVLSSWTDVTLPTNVESQQRQAVPKCAERRFLGLEHSSDEYATTFLMEFDKLFCTITKSKSPLVCKRPLQEAPSACLTVATAITPSQSSISSNALSTSAALNASNSSLSSIGNSTNLNVPSATNSANTNSMIVSPSLVPKDSSQNSNNGFRWFSGATSSYKLSKSVKKGAYLCFVIYNDCRIASTTDELLPLIQIDQHTPNTNLNNELAALQKYVTDIHLLKMVLKCLTRLSIPGSLEFRVKALSIVAEFLSALEPANSPPSSVSLSCSSAQSFSVCMSNRVITNNTQRDAVIFVCCVNCDACGKDASLPSGLKWCPYTRLLRRRPVFNSHTMTVPSSVTPSSSSQNLQQHPTGPTSTSDGTSMLHPPSLSTPISSPQLPDRERSGSVRGSFAMPNELKPSNVGCDEADIYSCLLTRLDDIVTCAKRLGEPLSPGLYLGYVKIRMTIDQMRLICSKQQPLIIPTVKMRDNPHVTREEWASLHLLKSAGRFEDSFNEYELSVANDFREMLSTAATKLHKFVVIGQQAPDYPFNHSLYINEVIELNDQVSLILLIPPLDEVFCMSSALDLTVNANRTSHLTEVHLANFEILCAQIYGTTKQQRAIALLSAIDLSLAVVQHVQRSMLHSDDVRAVKSGCEKIVSIQSKLDEYWRAQRWLIDILGRMRDRSKRSATLMLLSAQSLKPQSADEHRQNEKLECISEVATDKEVESCEISVPKLSPTSPTTRLSEADSQALVSTELVKQETDLDDKGIKQLSKVTTQPPSIVFSDSALTDVLPIDEALKIDVTPTELLEKNRTANLNHAAEETSPVQEQLHENALVQQQIGNASQPDSQSNCEEALGDAIDNDSVASSPRIQMKRKTTSELRHDFVSITETPRQRQLNLSMRKQFDAENAVDNSQVDPAGRIRIHIAYYSGLDDEAINVSIELLPKLTVKEIIMSTVRHVNELARASNPDNPYYSENELESFYLVVFAAQKEILLRDSFRPIDLQPPFRYGKFYISRRIKDFQNSVETML